MASTLISALPAPIFPSALFNAMPHIDDLPREREEEGRVSLGQPGPELKATIKSHGLLYDVAITLAHKHIDLQERDLVIGSYDPEDNKIVMSFRSLDNEADSELLANLVPFQFVYSRVHKWIPVAYWDSRAVYGDVMLERYQRMAATPLMDDFAKTMTETSSPAAAYVAGAGGEEFAKFGISLVFQTTVRGYEEGLMETTSDVERNQWFRLQSAMPARDFGLVVATIWHWRLNPDDLEDSCATDCMSNCVLHQWTHTHEPYGHCRAHIGR